MARIIEGKLVGSGTRCEGCTLLGHIEPWDAFIHRRKDGARTLATLVVFKDDGTQVCCYDTRWLAHLFIHGAPHADDRDHSDAIGNKTMEVFKVAFDSACTAGFIDRVDGEA